MSYSGRKAKTMEDNCGKERNGGEGKRWREREEDKGQIGKGKGRLVAGHEGGGN